MKTHLCLLTCLAGLALNSAMGQPLPHPAMPGMPPGAATAPPQAAAPRLTRFNLDFPGGTPKELVAAIQKATGKPLNVIVPDQLAITRLPALKMNNVHVDELFRALAAVSTESSPNFTGGYNSDGTPQYGWVTTSSSFSTEGQPTDDSIWRFVVNPPVTPTSSPQLPKAVCRFYSLAPYLERGLTVDDITTAIETGWEMLGDSPKPRINFHKETKLLIAVGEASKLETIDAVLKALAPAAAPPAGKPKAEK